MGEFVGMGWRGGSRGKRKSLRETPTIKLPPELTEPRKQAEGSQDGMECLDMLHLLICLLMDRFNQNSKAGANIL